MFKALADVSGTRAVYWSTSWAAFQCHYFIAFLQTQSSCSGNHCIWIIVGRYTLSNRILSPVTDSRIRRDTKSNGFRNACNILCCHTRLVGCQPIRPQTKLVGFNRVERRSVLFLCFRNNLWVIQHQDCNAAY